MPIDCSIRDNNPEEARRLCYGSASSASGGGQLNPAVSKAMVEGLGTIAFILIMPFAPLHVMMMLTPQTADQVAADRKRSNEEFAKVKAQIKERERRGRDIGKLAKQLADAEAGATDEVAAAKARVTPLPFTPPKLVSPASYNCTRAKLVMWYRDGWPLEGFESKGDFQGKCGPWTPAMNSKLHDVTTNACDPEWLTCGGTDRCCPKDSPIFNPCDTNCYRTSDDIFGAIEETAMRCNRYVSCGANVQ
jgi:hypothetical protein